MSAVRALIVIAAPTPVTRELSHAIRDDADVMGAQTLEEAIALLDSNQPDLVVVCYAFDEMRPFRLFAYIRHDLQWDDLPMVLVRALPVPLGATQEKEIRESYRTLGVAEFVNFRDVAEEHGVEAAGERFRTVIVSLLPPA